MIPIAGLLLAEADKFYSGKIRLKIAKQVLDGCQIWRSHRSCPYLRGTLKIIG